LYVLCRVRDKGVHISCEGASVWYMYFFPQAFDGVRDDFFRRNADKWCFAHPRAAVASMLVRSYPTSITLGLLAEWLVRLDAAWALAVS